MGKLNIAHHKSYHPYKSENIERVRRDEERAAAQEAGDRAKVMQADSEARIALLRKRAKKGKSREEDQAEKALERQLLNKGRLENSVEKTEETPVARKRDDTNVTIMSEDGHFNFFADLERGPANASTSRRVKQNADYEAEKKAAEEKWDRQITMYIEAPPQTWYDSKDGLKPAERKQTDDQRADKAYRESEIKRVEDPLATMQAYLARRDAIKAAEERRIANPWDDTPRTLRTDRTPIGPSRLARRKHRDGRHRQSPSPLQDVEEGPVRPSNTKAALPIEEATRQREDTERDRARGLLAARKRDTSSAASTPRSEFGYQTGMYNRTETRDAKRYSALKWNDERRDSFTRHQR